MDKNYFAQPVYILHWDYELLDKLEAEEHAKIMCTYPCPSTKVHKALNNA